MGTVQRNSEVPRLHPLAWKWDVMITPVYDGTRTDLAATHVAGWARTLRQARRRAAAELGRGGR